MSAYLLFASFDHVSSGVLNSIAQACHGKRAPLARLAKGDWIIYYSAKWKYSPESVKLTSSEARQNQARIFSAIGKVQDQQPFKAECQENQSSSSSKDSEVWRRSVVYIPSITPVPITPLLSSLNFIKNESHWGFYVRGGIVKLNQQDFNTISQAMGVKQQISSQLVDEQQEDIEETKQKKRKSIVNNQTISTSKKTKVKKEE
jgi:hypothetical protein